MAIALKGTPISTTVTSDGAGAASVNISALSLASGDCLLISVNEGGAADLSAPTATLNVSGAMTTDTDLYSNDTRDVNSATYSLILTGSDTSVAFAGMGATVSYVVTAWAYTGVAAAINDVTITTATGINTDAPNPAAITPTTAGAKIVAFYFGVQSASTVWTAPVNINNFAQAVVGGGGTNHPRTGVGDADWTSGAFDPAVVTNAEANAGDSWTAATYALRPAAAAATSRTFLAIF